MFEETFRKGDKKLNTERQEELPETEKEKGGEDVQGRENSLCRGPEAGRATERLWSCRPFSLTEAETQWQRGGGCLERMVKGEAREKVESGSK